MSMRSSAHNAFDRISPNHVYPDIYVFVERYLFILFAQDDFLVDSSKQMQMNCANL